MESLATFLQSDPARLLQLAKTLHEKNAFDKSLTDFQLQILTQVLQRDNVELWSNFLDGNCYLRVSKNEDSDATAKGDTDENIEEGNECINQIALHLRYLLWEKAIDYYYDKKKLQEGLPMPVIEELSDETELIESLDQIPHTASNNQDTSAPPAQKTVRDEEDDYDDDDDELDDGPTANGDVEGSRTALEYNEDGLVVLTIPKAVFSKASADDSEQELEKSQSSEDLSSSSALLEEQEAMIKSFNKVYHNFEYDRETLIKRRKLEKSDMQLESLKTLEDSATGSIPIHLGVASHSLKHLLSAIQERREDIALNDFELRNLFMDVRKNRGKWANDERVGQEELYEACEKVLLDLRGYTEHSTPFLNKVSKREAPNYGLIIKEPMDLNTVMKKLKGLSYNSKQEFVDDLMLIWNNCLTYNADPKHFMRAHAIAMQKRTQKLAPSIPNIVIKNRSEIEKEEELDADTKASTPAIKGGKSSKKGRMRKREDIIKAEETEGVISLQLSEATSTADTPIVTEEGTPLPTDDKSAELNGGEENGEEEEEDEGEGEDEMRGVEEDEEKDPEMQTWKNLTAKSRANYCATRAALFDEDNKLKMDAEAIIRDPSKMSNFNQFLSFKEVVSKGNKLLDNDEPYLLEYDVAGGVPGLQFSGLDDEAQQKFENDMVDVILQNSDGNPNDKSSELILPTDAGLNKLYTNNITEIQEIRKICFKISLIRQMQTQQFVHRTQMRQPEIEYIKEVDIDPVSKLSNHDIYNEQVQFAALRKGIAKIAMHTGFETTEPFAINTLAQLAEKYMLNLAKSMKLHCESTTSNKLSDRDVLLLSLLENGVEKPDDLFTFVEEKAKKHEGKLKDLRMKLSGFLKDLLRPSLESFNEKSFEDNSEQFATGDFTSELGDDFFGFKELGLDKEFKMLSSSIPVYLLHSRLQSSLTNAGSANKATRYEDLRDWKQKQLTVSDVGSQIGLLQPFYWELVQKTEVHYAKQQKRKGESTELPPPSQLYLMEDEELPQKQRNIRPRLPPTGKIAAVKKKILSSAYILPEEDEDAEEMDTSDMFDLKSEIKMEA